MGSVIELPMFSVTVMLCTISHNCKCCKICN